MSAGQHRYIHEVYPGVLFSPLPSRNQNACLLCPGNTLNLEMSRFSRLYTLLRVAIASWVFDGSTSVLSSPLLCSVLPSSGMAWRAFGKSKEQMLPEEGVRRRVRPYQIGRVPLVE